MLCKCKKCGAVFDDRKDKRYREYCKKEENPECYRERQKEYEDTYYKKYKDIIIARKDKGSSRLGPHRCENFEEERKAIQKEMNRFKLFNRYQTRYGYDTKIKAGQL